MISHQYAGRFFPPAKSAPKSGKVSVLKHFFVLVKRVC